MNNKLKLAVAAALVAGASSANAGIIIPAGDWTLDIGGVVNAYYTNTRASGDAVWFGGTERGDKSVHKILQLVCYLTTYQCLVKHVKTI
jgi:hypothetical protein